MAWASNSKESVSIVQTKERKNTLSYAVTHINCISTYLLAIDDSSVFIETFMRSSRVSGAYEKVSQAISRKATVGTKTFQINQLDLRFAITITNIVE